MSTPAPLAPTGPKRFRRRLTTLLVGLAAMLAVPGTAFAYTEPITPGAPNTAELADRNALDAIAAHAASSGSTASSSSSVSTALVIALVAVLAVAIVIVASRVLRRRAPAPRPVRV